MKIGMVQVADAGGAPYRLQLILTKHLGYEVERLQATSVPYGFPKGKPLTRESVLELADRSDVVHFHTALTAMKFGPLVRQQFPQKKLCMTAHGVESMGARAKHAAALIGRVVYVSPNLENFYPLGTFIPNAVDPEQEQFSAPIPLAVKRSRGVPYILRAFSVMKRFKNWPEFDRFARTTGLTTLTFATALPNPDLRAEVGAADFIWDHIQGYWGQQTVEAFWLGAIPVVMPDENARRKANEFFGERVPFGPTTLEGWVEFVKNYQESREFAEFAIQTRLNFAKNFWRPDRIARVWKHYYENL